MNNNLKSLIEDYINTVSKYDYTLGNETHNLYKLIKCLKHKVSELNPADLKLFLDTVSNSKSLSVQLNAAILSIEHKYKIEEAKTTIINIRKMSVKETKSYAPSFATDALTGHILDERYPYVCDVFRKTAGLMKKSLIRAKNNVRNKKIMIIISGYDQQTIESYIDFLNNRKHDGCFLYYGALLSFKYNYKIDDARKNMTMISSNASNWGKTSKLCANLLIEHQPLN